MAILEWPRRSWMRCTPADIAKVAQVCRAAAGRAAVCERGRPTARRDALKLPLRCDPGAAPARRRCRTRGRGPASPRRGVGAPRSVPSGAGAGSPPSSDRGGVVADHGHLRLRDRGRMVDRGDRLDDASHAGLEVDVQPPEPECLACAVHPWSRNCHRGARRSPSASESSRNRVTVSASTS